MILLKSQSEIEKMRLSGRAVARTLRIMGEAIDPGKTSTADLNQIAELVMAEMGARPAFKGYRGYPAAACISVNNEVVHGIPAARILQEGDIVGLDVGACIDGYYADAAWTYPVGTVSSETQRLMNVTLESLWQGIAQAKDGNSVGDISHAVQRYVEKNGYSIVKDLSGHGIGRALHEDPSISNFGKAGSGERLKSGMTLCIEPMVNMGNWKVHSLSDRWTIVTDDGSLSAHYEHTVAISRDGAVILTTEDET
ncbi:MAG: type I methionyl aminopeptidase [bacterium]